MRKKRRASTKVQTRAIATASLEVIQKKKSEKPEQRKASREAALRCARRWGRRRVPEGRSCCRWAGRAAGGRAACGELHVSAKGWYREGPTKAGVRLRLVSPKYNAGTAKSGQGSACRAAAAAARQEEKSCVSVAAGGSKCAGLRSNWRWCFRQRIGSQSGGSNDAAERSCQG